MSNLPKIPIGQWVDQTVSYLNSSFGYIFEWIAFMISTFVDFFVFVTSSVPALIFILLLAALTYVLSQKAGLTFLTLFGLLLIWNIGYWEQTLNTLALVLTSVIISIIVGIPLGIVASQSDGFSKFITPILDFMQTMPAFVYLIPSIIFFGIGVVPGIIASVIFAMPPTIRLTNLGIRQVPEYLIEAADAFGSTTKQKLLKVQLPLAASTIMAGINQCIMLALSMVVIASLVGAPGLGVDVYRAVTRIEVGKGFEAGLSIVILAIILDRLTQNLNFGIKRNAKNLPFKR
ncbi:ABC transporter permease [Bacillus alveayuensis]|jgi:glycine betaine/proline transport system permease protein|uniref:Glycine betaine/proline transport system permease protein n=1 Tax=Aeribacillus alveayuensis TaxID=279215 RepID=A0ABT9VKH6_9BACI|nr:proline/glycine betaine ABC transporter permease [Bacillus alveayuensis]MDQ0161457.1 glycine betaine/proline transport system permease protein [Bacillus alveayuensis]